MKEIIRALKITRAIKELEKFEQPEIIELVQELKKFNNPEFNFFEEFHRKIRKIIGTTKDENGEELQLYWLRHDIKDLGLENEQREAIEELKKDEKYQALEYREDKFQFIEKYLFGNYFFEALGRRESRNNVIVAILNGLKVYV